MNFPLLPVRGERPNKEGPNRSKKGGRQSSGSEAGNFVALHVSLNQSGFEKSLSLFSTSS